LLLDSPQRQSEKAGFVSITFPAPSSNSTSPVILSEPLSFTLICTFVIPDTPSKIYVLLSEYIEYKENASKQKHKLL
jgi:hypothetical protein